MVKEQVTVDNYVRAETDTMLKTYAAEGAFGSFFHIRQPTPIDEQHVIRMNLDTLYSVGIFDLEAGGVTIVKPDAAGRFQSMQVIDEDHFVYDVYYEPGEYALSKKQGIGTRYVVVLLRTYMDASSQEDIKLANAVQDGFLVTTKDVGALELPDWDHVSLVRAREAANVLAATRKDTTGMFGKMKDLDILSHLLGAAYGWGGNPCEDAIYVNFFPEENDGTKAYTVTFGEIPVDGFASVTMYNKEGFMEKNDLNAYFVNVQTSKKNPDGKTTTVHFGGDPSRPNFLPITSGWNYVVRLYRPHKEIIDGSWTFPAPTLTE